MKSTDDPALVTGVSTHQAFLPWKEYRYEELLLATGHFSRDNLLGEGAFGSVYRAALPDGTPVAVKELKALLRVSGKKRVCFWVLHFVTLPLVIVCPDAYSLSQMLTVVHRCLHLLELRVRYRLIV